MQNHNFYVPLLRCVTFSMVVVATLFLLNLPLIALGQAPTITSTNPSTIPTGEFNRVTVNGTNFISGTVILFNGSVVPTNYVSSTSVNIYLSAEPNLAGTLTLVAQNPGGSQSAAYSISLGIPSSTWADIESTVVRTTPTGFMGLSHEWGDAEWTMGDTARGVNSTYRQLITNLMDSPNSPFLIRVGGASTDSSTTPNSVTEFNQLNAALPGVKFTTGVILGPNTNSMPNTAETIAASYVSNMTPGILNAIEIGNEPDSYQYETSLNYTFDVYKSKYSQWVGGIRQTVSPAAPAFTGPSWASMRTLLNDNYWSGFVNEPPSYLQLFIDAQQNNTTTITQHWYSGMISSSNPAGSFEPSFLLGYPPSSSPGPLQYANPGVTPYYWVPSVLGWAASLAHQNGMAYRVNESNSIDEGGVPGVSNSFAAALWGVDYMFELVNAGVDGDNFHGANGGLRVSASSGKSCTYAWGTLQAPCIPPPAYAPFTFDIEHTNGGYPLTYTLNNVNPLYYGLYFFHMAVPDGAQLLQVSMQSPHNIKVWATKDSYGTIRVVIINKDQTWSGNVPIYLSGYGNGQALMMTCANGFAGTLQYANDNATIGTTGITIGGQTWDGSTDGTIQGTQTPVMIVNYSNVYYVPMQPGTAALLTLTP